MSLKLNYDGVSPFTGNNTLLFEYDDVIEATKIICTESGWFTFMKTKTTEEEYKKLAPTEDDQKRNYFDPQTGLIWYPDIQLFFMDDDSALSLQPDFDNIQDVKSTPWTVSETTKEGDFYTADLSKILQTGNYIDCLNKCFYLKNTEINECA